jgi:hypothetical protein
MTTATLRRHAGYVAVTVGSSFLLYLFLYFLPAVAHTIYDQPAQQNGACPYTLYEQYHPTDFHLPADVCK